MENSTFNIDDFGDDNTWDLICDGQTKGVFQLESQLGRSWSKRVKPRSIEGLAALVSLIRPGCLKAFTEGKSMTQHYVDRKSGVDAVTYLHDSLKPILEETYGVLVYQEQSMRIAQKIAGFNLQDADMLRKAIGKKKARLMARVKKSFLEGASNEGIVTKAAAEEIFSWIEKSSRYAFNKSHAVSYAVNAYRSAYCKVHRKLKFFESYLNHSDRKIDPHFEIRELVSDARLYGIEVLPPRLNNFYARFTSSDNKVYFGINNVKGVGATETEKILKTATDLADLLGKSFSEFTWADILFNMGVKINKTSMESLISVGAFNGANNKKNRSAMLYEYSSYRDLSPREREWLAANYNSSDTFVGAVDALINNLKINSNRLIKVFDIRNMAEKPPYDLTDHIGWIASTEEKYLGCGLTCCKTDAVETSIATSSCREISKGGGAGKIALLVHINSLREYKTKTGKNPGEMMAFLSVEDGTASLDSVIAFPETYDSYKGLLFEGNTVLLFGQLSKKKDGSLIINKVSDV